MVKIADFYKVDVGDKRVKETVKVNFNLLKMKVLGAAEAVPVAAGTEGSPLMSASLSFEQQQELLLLPMKLETEKEVAVEKMHQGIEMEKVLSVEKLRQETEQAKIELQRQKLTLDGEGRLRLMLCLLIIPLFQVVHRSLMI